MVRYAPGVYEKLLSQGLINTENSMPINLPNLTGTQMPRGGKPIPEQGPRFMGSQPLTPPPINSGAMETIQKQYGQYGFSDEIMDFLARNQQLGFIDAGKNISYDPDSQTFSVGQGGRMAPTGESLKFNIDEFTNYVRGILKPPSRPEINPEATAVPTSNPPTRPRQPNPQRPAIQGPIIPSMIESPSNITNQLATGVGIGSLTQSPINTTPESKIMGSMTSSPYLNNNQDLDQYLNSYVENLINRRMRDVFGGIMSIFQ